MDVKGKYGETHNFGLLDPEFSDFKTSRVCILPTPFEATASYHPGTVMGPAAIIEASKNMELYDEELGLEPYTIGIHTAGPVVLPRGSMAEALEMMEASVSHVLRAEKFPIIIGGEHSLTIACARAFQKFYPDLSILQIDAHADLRDEWDGTPLSHACVMRRIVDHVPAVVQVGIRSMTREEHDFARRRSLKMIMASEIASGEGRWMENALSGLGRHVYITVDADGLDPSIMPSVGTPEPGGMDWHATLDLLKKVARSKKVVGFDFVELCPIPGLVAPDFLAAKLIYKMIGYVFEKHLRK
jgi:agmatinase